MHGAKHKSMAMYKYVEMGLLLIHQNVSHSKIIAHGIDVNIAINLVVAITTPSPMERNNDMYINLYIHLEHVFIEFYMVH